MGSLSIRSRLMIVVGATVFVLVTLYGLYNYQQARDRLSKEVSELIDRTGTDTARFVSSWLDSRQAILDGAAEALSEGRDILPVVSQGAASAEFLYMYVGTPDGQMLIRPSTELPADFDPRTRPWYQQAQSAGSMVLTPPYTDAASGDLIMTFARPVGDSVIAADVPLTRITDQVLGVRLAETGYAALIDSQGNFLVHPDEQLLGSAVAEWTESPLASSPMPLTAGNNEWIAAQYPIDGTDWRIALFMDRNEAYAGLGGLLTGAILATGLTILIVTLVCGFMISRLLQPLRRVNRAMSDIAQGEADLTRRLEITHDDEVGSLSRSFNRFVESIQGLVSSSLDSSRHLTELSESARDNARQNSEAIRRQQSEISQVATAINQMSSTAAEVASNAAETADAAAEARKEGENGIQGAHANRERMGQLTERIDSTTDVINRLNEQAQKITTILSTIEEVAEQTNLLALNAAIEAARAGEHGRGFAVVADEVRALSKRTHDATGEIQGMIEELQVQTREAVSMMDSSRTLTGETADSAKSVRASLESVGDAISDISHRANTIAEAAGEQNKATDEISRIATAIQDAADELAHNVDGATSQSDELHELSNDLKASLARFHV